MKLTCFKHLLLYFLLFLFTEVKSQTILSESFEGSFPPAGWTLTNTGGTPWTQVSGRAVSGTKSMQCLNNVNADANAWAFTPLLNLSINTFYRISYWYTALNSERIKVTIGNEANTISQTTIIHDYPGIQNSQPLEGVDTISVPLTGNYSIGFNCYSFNNSPGVYIDSIVVQKINPVACNGIPFVGSVSGPIAVAPATIFSLSLSGLYSVYSGIHFQWQSSAEGINNFQDIPSATTQVFNTSQNVSQDYRCIVTCSNTGSTAISNVLNVPLTSSGSLFRQKYVGDTSLTSHINGMFFLSPSTGFVAFLARVGFTQDSGQTYTMRPIVAANTDYNGYAVNLTFGFRVTGVYAFSTDSLLAYGDFGAEPSILFSADQGANWKVVFHQPYNLDQDIGNSFFDMKFISRNEGIAINQKYIVETTDKGQTWTVKTQIPSYSSSQFAKLSALPSSIAYAIAGNDLYKRIGGSWVEMRNPVSTNTGLNFNNISFSSNTTGYISRDDNYGVYKTIDGGITWTKMNDTAACPVSASDLYFINDSTGFACAKSSYDVLKTINSGVTWEVCKKNTSYQYESYGMDRLFFLNDMTGWAGGRGEYLMLTTSGGSPTIPKAVFKIDTTNLTSSGTVNLINSSNAYYQYKWYKNDVLIGSSYNMTYIHDIYVAKDTIMLIVSNGTDRDTLIQYQEYNFTHPPLVTSFNPASGTANTVVTISGFGFTGTTSVTFGGIPATSFTVISSTTITAIVPGGLSGDIAVTTPIGTGTAQGFIYLIPPAPSITSFYPENGPIGTTVTITGSNYSTLAAENVVYFGRMRANILSSSANQIVCKVPSGASFDPIIVVNRSNNGVGYSFKPFGVTFPGGNNMTPTSFIRVLQLPTDSITSNDIFPVFARAADIDGDGRNDIIGAVRYYSVADSIFIYRNSTTSDSLSFEKRQNVGTGSSVAIGDIDGDGKLDLVFIDNFNTIGILRNTSIAGNISFAPIIKITLTNSPHSLDIRDVDGDGRADIILSGYNNGTLGILQNVSTVASISFSPIIEFPANTYAYNLGVGDLNGDGKPDVIIVARSASNVNLHLISILKNTSTRQKISFAPKTDLFIPAQTTAQELPFIADMNNDNKLDIVLNTGSGTPAKAFVVFKNTSTSDSITFAPELDFSNTTYEQSTTGELSNFNGDSLPDLITGNYYSNTFDFLKNESVGNTISLNLTNSYGLNGDIWSECGSDLNGDGKPDVIVATAFNNPSGNRGFHIYKNMIGEANTVTICENGRVNLVASISGASYQWQQKTGNASFVNIIDNLNYLGAQSNILQLINAPLTLNGVIVRCLVNGTTYTNEQLIRVKAVTSPMVDIAATSTNTCYKTNVTFTATANPGNGINTSYQWLVNGNSVLGDSMIYSTNNLHNNDRINCVIINYDSCLTIHSDTSNTITMIITGDSNSVSISTSAVNICKGNSVTFTAITTNAGTSSYQWVLNGINVGTNTNTYISSSLNDNDTIYCVVTINGRCSVQSNTITMSVNSNVTPGIVITTPDSTICAGVMATFTATVSNGGAVPLYQWQLNGINTGTNSNTFSSAGLTNNDQVKCILTSNALCSSPVTVSSNIINITVALTPEAPSVSITTDNTTICSNDSATFKATSTNGGSNPNYQWQVNGINAGSDSNIFTTNSLANGSIVTAILKSNLPCASPLTVTSNSLIIAVNTVTPSALISASSSSICPGEPITFTVTLTNGGVTPAYQWKKNNVNVGTNSNTYSDSTFVDGDDISVALTSNAACAIPSLVNSNDIIITVAHPSIATINISGVTLVSPGTSSEILTVVTNAGINPAYQWQDSTRTHLWTNIPGAISSTLNYMPLLTGDKLRCLLAANSVCTPSITTISNTLIFNLIGGRTQVHVYPNPVRDKITIDSLSIYDEWQTLTVVSATGTESNFLQNIAGQSKIELDVSTLASGLYIGILRNKSGKAEFFKFVKI